MCVEAECVMVAAFCSSWLLLYGNQCNCSEILGPLCSFIYVADQLCHNSETIFSHQLQYIPGCVIITCSLLSPHFLDGFFHFTSQNIRPFSSASTSSSGSTTKFSGRLGRSYDSTIWFSQIFSAFLLSTIISPVDSSMPMFWIPWFSFQPSSLLFMCIKF